MRAQAYILTFMSYASIHMLRMTYSFNKHNIKLSFGIGEFFLGILDSLIFISLAIGTFYRYSILNDKRHTLVLLKTAIPTAIAFCLVPLLSLYYNDETDRIPRVESQVFLLVALGCFGFFQFASFPLSLTIFSHHFHVKTEGSLVGFWSSKSNAGNIIGFFLSNFLVYQLSTAWQTPMILCSIFHILIGVLLYEFVKDKNDINDPQITTQEFFQFMKKKWGLFDFKLYILSFSCFKAILYSYELWTPSFLVDSGFAKYSGYVPMVFDISTLFGSYFMGKLYQKQEDLSTEARKDKKIILLLKKYKFFISSMIISIISILYILIPSNIVLYFLLGIAMGVFLGAVYNSLENNQILHQTNNNPRDTDMMATLNIVIGSCLVGAFQILIGAFIHLGHKRTDIPEKEQSHNYGVIYIAIAVLGFVATWLTFMRSYYTDGNPEDAKIREVELQSLKENLIEK